MPLLAGQRHSCAVGLQRLNPVAMPHDSAQGVEVGREHFCREPGADDYALTTEVAYQLFSHNSSKTVSAGMANGRVTGCGLPARTLAIVVGVAVRSDATSGTSFSLAFSKSWVLEKVTLRDALSHGARNDLISFSDHLISG